MPQGEWSGSVLWVGGPPVEPAPADPATLADLNLDQILAAVTAPSRDYRLGELFQTPLPDVDAVAYRHEVFRDLERAGVQARLDEFADGMREMRRHLAQAERLHHAHQKKRWHLDAVATYSRTVTTLHDALTKLELTSRGLLGWTAYLGQYVESSDFRKLVDDTTAVQQELDAIRYTVHVNGQQVRVARFDGQSDYTTTVEAAFARFRRTEGTRHAEGARHSDPSTDWADMNPLEKQILKCVAELHPTAFRALEAYCDRHRDFVDPTIGTFDREIQFYSGYLAFTRRFTRNGLPFSYPQVTTAFDEIYADEAYDVAVAIKLIEHQSPVVRNAFRLSGRERVLVVTGPNQGGKSTFARMFGQLAHLAAIGCLVPAINARLLLPDKLFTHFEREETLPELQGKLKEELARIHDILMQATDQSIVVMNESFSSTTTEDAIRIGADILKQIIGIGAVALYVTFIDELAALDKATISMVAGLAADDPTRRTFRIERRPADGIAHAAAIADRHSLGYEAILARITR